MTHIDDLKRGDWITVIYDSVEEKVNHIEYRGSVAKILEIDLPFICIESDGRISAIDVRSKQVQRVGKRYAKLMRERVIRRRKTKADKLELARCCKYCGARLVQRLIRGVWWFSCPECGTAGDPVPSE